MNPKSLLDIRTSILPMWMHRWTPAEYLTKQVGPKEVLATTHLASYIVLLVMDVRNTLDLLVTVADKTAGADS
jgi:hypothetical protein